MAYKHVRSFWDRRSVSRARVDSQGPTFSRRHLYPIPGSAEVMRLHRKGSERKAFPWLEYPQTAPT